MRSRTPTQQFHCKKCDKLTEHYQFQRTGSTELEKGNCTICQRAYREGLKKRKLTPPPKPEPGKANTDTEVEAWLLAREEMCRLDPPTYKADPEPEPRAAQPLRHPPGPPWFGQLIDPQAFYQATSTPHKSLAEERRAIRLAVAAHARKHPAPRRVYPG